MQVKVKESVYIYLAALLLLVPIPWLGAWLFAIAFHELCHYLFVRLFGGRIDRITIGIGGARMDSSGLSKYQSIMALLMGPVGGLLLTLSGRWLPRTALCCGLLSVYNLLPLSFLDGGKIVCILLGEGTIRWVEQLCMAVLSVIALYFSVVMGLGLLPIAVVGGLWLKKVKSSCKQTSFKIQYR